MYATRAQVKYKMIATNVLNIWIQKLIVVFCVGLIQKESSSGTGTSEAPRRTSGGITVADDDYQPSRTERNGGGGGCCG